MFDGYFPFWRLVFLFALASLASARRIVAAVQSVPSAVLAAIYGHIWIGIH